MVAHERRHVLDEPSWREFAAVRQRRRDDAGHGTQDTRSPAARRASSSAFLARIPSAVFMLQRFLLGARRARILALRAMAALTLAATSDASAQCCLGAQDCDHTAHNGRYRVRATSQTGTGPQAHGPYRFAFAYEERDADGSWRELGAFERSWDTKAHFSMTVCASPTGNGFLLSTSMDDTVVLLSRDGRTLRDLRGDKARADIALWTPKDREPYLVAQVDGQDLRARLFVPFAEAIQERCWSQTDRDYTATQKQRVFAVRDDERRSWLAMLTWSSAQARDEEPRVRAAIAQASSANAEDRERGSAAIVQLGMSARLPLANAILAAKGDNDDELRARLVPVRDRIDQLACGHDAPHRNLDLLAALLSHPDEELRLTAAGQLRHILPKGAEATAAWLRENAARLQWDEASGAFVKKR